MNKYERWLFENEKYSEAENCINNRTGKKKGCIISKIRGSRTLEFVDGYLYSVNYTSYFPEGDLLNISFGARGPLVDRSSVDKFIKMFIKAGRENISKMLKKVSNVP